MKTTDIKTVSGKCKKPADPKNKKNKEGIYL